MLKKFSLRALQKGQTTLPIGFKSFMKSLPWVSPVYRSIAKKLYFDPSLYHRSALRQEGLLEAHIPSAPAVDDPTFHLVLCCEQYDAEVFNRCISSVLEQTYEKWHLHIFCPDSSVQGGLLGNNDERVSFVASEKFLSASDAANIVVSKSPDDFLLLLKPDGTLNVQALSVFARVLAEKPDIEVVYADEDCVNNKGLRHSPRFKPDWNPDLLYSYNYLGHPVVYQCSAVQIVGGFNDKHGEWAEYDLLLRLELATQTVKHVDLVLYTTHSNNIVSYDDIMPLPPVPSPENNPLTAFFKNAPEITISDGLVTGTAHICWPLPKQLPLVSLIIPTRNNRELVQQCIESIVGKTTYENYEILLIDNQSDEPDALKYFDALSDQENIRVLRYDNPFNYSAINNFAVEQSKGTIIGFINNDIEVIDPDWLREMVSQALREEIGCVGAKLYFPDGLIQHGGVVIGYGGGADHAFKYLAGGSPGYMNRLKVVQNFSAVTAACLVMRKSLFEEIGGFNEKDLPVNFNDTDLCLRVLEKGYRNLWTPYAELFHHESASRGEDLTPEKRERYEREVAYIKNVWNTDTWKDPAYNPNLSLMRHDFAIRELT